MNRRDRRALKYGHRGVPKRDWYAIKLDATYKKGTTAILTERNGVTIVNDTSMNKDK